MSMFRRNHDHSVPGLNMSSMPDLIFTVLFFFMIVTHMRSVPVKVRVQVPQGTELTKLTRKSAVTYIYIGQPMTGSDKGQQPSTRIQLNDKFATADQVAPFVMAERLSMSPDDKQAMTVSIKADKETDMGTITDVKQQLRKAKAYRINYSASYR
ncbi:MAG: biopolymer transporter ExbD [Prevotella sp.]|nr:biopolymer transporter ExbD [Prevotella sp.]